MYNEFIPEYRRIWIEGGTFFFTLVTYQRRRFLTEPKSRELLHAAWEQVNQRFPFTTQMVCLLPDHLHCIWSLPENDTNYALRWGEIKKIFTKTWHKQIGKTWPDEISRLKRGEGAIWQRRFWEHATKSTGGREKPACNPFQVPIPNLLDDFLTFYTFSGIVGGAIDKSSSPNPRALPAKLSQKEICAIYSGE